MHQQIPGARRAPPRLLSIAGSDSGGGAGIQADLKTFSALGTYGMTVVTAVTAQNTRSVTAVHEVPPAVVAAQIDAVFGDIGVDAVKIGMLASAKLIAVVAERLRFWQGPPVVLDPVMVAKSGDPLLADAAVGALIEELLPLAVLVTPNLPEARRLTGLPVETPAQRREAARALARSGPAVLIKGGHGPGDEVEDFLLDGNLPDGEAWFRFAHPRLRTTSTHGTGCTLSSAIAARLGAGVPLARAVEEATAYVHGAIREAFPLGSGHGPVHHFYRLREGLEGAPAADTVGPDPSRGPTRSVR